jgi:hypoxanthine phosphoribosyltransferase
MATTEVREFSVDGLSLSGNEIRLHTFPGEEKPEDYMVICQGATDYLAYSLAQNIQEDIKAGNWSKPDLVIAVLRGGAVPGRRISDLLGNLPMITVGIGSDYGPDRSRRDPQVYQDIPPLEELQATLRTINSLGKNQRIENVLVVEEIVDDGLTAEKVLQNIREKWGIGEDKLRLCSLVVKERALARGIGINYYKERIPDSTWAIFSWEVAETIGKLVGRWKSYTKPLSDKEIKGRLGELGFSESDIEAYWPQEEVS